MTTFIRLISLLSIILLFWASPHAQAQVCTPDSSYTSAGFYPATMPTACINQPYDFTVTLVVPLDTLVSFPPLPPTTVPIDSFIVMDVLNLPNTMSYACNPGNCVFPGNTRGCVQLSGTPNALGRDTLDIDILVWVNAPFVGSTSVRDTIQAVYILEVVTPPVANITGDTSVCAGGSTLLDAGPGFTSYLWSNGDTTQTTSITAGGSYSVLVGTGNCTDSDTVSITQFNAPTIATAVTDATCGQTNGSATATPSGNGPFTYLWNTGANTASITNLGAGPYTVTVTDDNGCATLENVTVGSIGGATVTQGTITDVSCAGSSDGGATVNVSGGMMPYTYSWSNGDMTQNLNGVAGGTYTLTLTDANSCISTLMVTVSEPTALGIASAGQVNVSCNGGNDGTAVATAAGGTMPYTYAWSNGQAGAMASNLAAGMYVAVATDNNGCKDSISVTISEPNPLSNSSTIIDPECNGDATGEISLSVSGGTPTYAFLWNTGSTSNNLTGVPAGTYTCEITDGKFCKDTVTLTINEPPALVAQTGFVATTPGKNDGKAWVTPSGGTPPYIISWSTGATSDTIMDLAPGLYTVTVTDGNGCKEEEDVNVEGSMGIEDDLAAGVSELAVFPNPTHGVFTLELSLNKPDEVRLSLFDTAGRELYRKAPAFTQHHRAVFDLGGEAPGLYVLKISTSRGVTVRRVLKK